MMTIHPTKLRRADGKPNRALRVKADGPRLASESEAHAWGKAHAKTQGWNNIALGRFAKACAAAWGHGAKAPEANPPHHYSAMERHAFAQGQSHA